MAHVAWSQPLDHVKRPERRTPPSTGVALPSGATDDDTNAVGSSSQISCCNSSDINAIMCECWASSPDAHAVDAHAPAMSTTAGPYTSAPTSTPPKRFGWNARKNPASRSAAIFVSLLCLQHVARDQWQYFGDTFTERCRRVPGSVRDLIDMETPVSSRNENYWTARSCWNAWYINDGLGYCQGHVGENHESERPSVTAPDPRRGRRDRQRVRIPGHQYQRGVEALRPSEESLSTGTSRTRKISSLR